MHKILVTCFEPFGNYSDNSSRAVAEKMIDLHLEGVAIEQMPVSFQRVAAAFNKAIEKHQPEVIIMLGQSSLATAVKLERVALNLMDSSKGDSDGYKPDEVPIHHGEHEALFTTLPIKKLHQALLQKNIQATISNSCGLYVCNTLYYEALRRCLEGTMKALFVHLPLYDGQPVTNSRTQTRPLDEMIQAVVTIITTIYDTRNDI